MDLSATRTPSFDPIPSEKTILSYLLRAGPYHGFKIHTDTELSEKTTYTSLKSLTEKGLLTRRGPGEDSKPRPGQEMKIYEFTLKGFLAALSLEKEAEHYDQDWPGIDAKIKTWKHLLPFVFERWNKFQKHEVKKEALHRLRFEVSASKHLYGLPNFKAEPEQVTERFYMLSSDNPKWEKMLISDNELKTFYITILESDLEHSKNEVKRIQQKLDALYQRPN